MQLDRRVLDDPELHRPRCLRIVAVFGDDDPDRPHCLV